MSSLSRRNLLQGRWQQRDSVIRPPWAVSESQFIEHCSRCHACIKSCQTQVIVCGVGGFPELDFQRAECNFCGRCRQVCNEAVFDKETEVPWHYKAEVNSPCLTYQRIECRICHDSCELSAIQFKLEIGRVAAPIINTTKCSGCGACVSQCPVKAISITASAPISATIDITESGLKSR